MKIRKVLLSCVLVLATALVCLLALPTEAEAATSGYYNYTVSNSEATITGYNGGGGDVTIPSTLDGYPVTTIGDSAFYNCDSLTSITIPDSVTTIGDRAFYICSSLTSIAIPDGVTTIGKYAFDGCTSLESINIPDSVTTIGYSAFSGCWSLTSVTIGDSVTTIGGNAFCYCTNLESITIPDSVTTIGSNAFAWCGSLTYHTYDNAEYLGNSNNPYRYLISATSSSITSCTIHNSTKVIGGSAFSGCDSLTEITIPDSVASIGDYAFYECTSLTDITIPDSVTTIDVCAFGGCSSLTSVTIGDSVTTIGRSAFWNCTSLTSITIGNSVTTIGGSVFSGCSSLADVYYNGGKTLKNKISVDMNNSAFMNAKWHYAPCILHVYADVCDEECNECETIRVPPHDYAAATCTAPKTCKVCFATEGKALGHDYAAATYTAPKTCKRCGDTVGEPLSISISQQPQSVSVASGKTATISVTATGEGLKYQWYYSWEGKFLKCSGTGKATYSITMNESRAGRQMYCVITDKYGNTVQSDTVTLGMKITITKQPVSVNALNGKTVSFSVGATGAGLKYQWYYSWEGEFLACSGTGKSSYSITMNKDRAGRQMYCVITDKFGNSVQTNTVTMYIGAMITQQPKSVQVKNGEKAIIRLSAIGEGLKYQWYYKYNGKFVKSSDVGQPTYSITMNKDRAGRQMYCVITDKFGNSVKSSTVTLGMAVSISKQPVSVTVANGKTAKISVTATGDGLKYQWYYSWEGKFLKCSGTGKSSYSIAMNESRAGRQMYCVITDKYGNKVQTDTVTLGMTFAITKQPTSTSAALGKSAKVSLTATGAGLKYQWYYSWEGEFLACSGTGKSSYSITMTEARAGRQMYCVITDKFGNSIQSNTVTLHKGPTITQQPKSVQVKNGAKATISLTATGEGLKYQWYYKYKGKFLKSSDVGQPTYSITMNKDRAGRQMYCIITDKYGTSVKSDVVTLGMAVSISTQPKTVTVAKGKTAKISVTATGDGLKYQWYYSWKGEFLKCSGTGKSSYSITMSKDRAGRQMYCVITDKYGNQVQTNTVTLKMK